MGLIDRMLDLFFGSGRNPVVEVAEVFRENAEAGAIRAADAHSAALKQFASEFQNPRQGWFDRLIDGLNRLPRPAMAFGTLGLLSAAMIDPIWFSDRMAGLQTVPEPLWWLLGAIVSFYFGARHQVKTQEFQKTIFSKVAKPLQKPEKVDPSPTTDNPALDDWHRWRGTLPLASKR